MGNKIKTKNRIGFRSLLAVLFTALKLTGHINWPWIWVLSPIWIPIALAIVILAATFLLVTLAGVLK